MFKKFDPLYAAATAALIAMNAYAIFIGLIKRTKSRRRGTKPDCILVKHDSDNQIGVVASVKAGDDRGCRSKVHFGRRAPVDEIPRVVIDGIRSHASSSTGGILVTTDLLT